MVDDLTITSQLGELARARTWVGDHARAAGMPEQAVNELRLAVSEAVANVIEHGYRGEPNHAIDLHLAADDNQLVLTIHDDGDPFELQAYEPPDLDQPHEGGYGVFLIRSLTDEVHYETPAGGGTTLTLVKYYRPNGAEGQGA
jgi:serine/threonine-protein kinase RsbW